MVAITGERLRLVALTVACVAWFGLGLQLYLLLLSRWDEQASLLGGLMTFFSYFTVLSNTLAAAVLTGASSRRQGRVVAALRKPWVIAGVAASIVLVGIAYSLLLRNLWAPQGWQWLANEILHDVMPVVFFGYWLIGVEKGQVRAWHLLAWTLYPVVYFACILIRGDELGVYPYPFVNVLKLGYAQIWLNALGVLGGFWVIAGSVMLIDWAMGKRR